MCENISVTESTVRSLQIIFAYQGQQLIKKIGKKKGWTDEETESLIKEFINKKNLEIKNITNPTNNILKIIFKINYRYVIFLNLVYP